MNYVIAVQVSLHSSTVHAGEGKIDIPSPSLLLSYWSCPLQQRFLRRDFLQSHRCFSRQCLHVPSQENQWIWFRWTGRRTTGPRHPLHRQIIWYSGHVKPHVPPFDERNRLEEVDTEDIRKGTLRHVGKAAIRLTDVSSNFGAKTLSEPIFREVLSPYPVWKHSNIPNFLATALKMSPLIATFHPSSNISVNQR